MIYNSTLSNQNLSSVRLKRRKQKTSQDLYYVLHLYVINKAEAVTKKLPSLPFNDPRRKAAIAAYHAVVQSRQTFKPFSLFSMLSLKRIFSIFF